jgi:hypothetical protein
MPSLTTCLKQAGDLITPELRRAILKRAEELRGQGLPEADVAKRAVAEVQAERQGSLQEVETAVKDGATLYETPPETPAAKAEAEAAVSRVDQVVRDMPELQVRMDGMDAPMPVADFLAAVKAEADEMAADAPLMQIAAECALMNGL